MTAIPFPPVMLVTDRHQANHPLDHIVAEACKAGCRWISLREKDLDYHALSELYQRLYRIVEPWGGMLGVHADAETAWQLGAKAVHLPATENARHARSVLGRDCLIGQSCHGKAECLALDPEYVDYGLLGPLFPTPSKPGYQPRLSLQNIAELVPEMRVPLVGIGGIEPVVVSDIMRSGMQGIAVMGSVMRAEDSAHAVARLIAHF